MPAPALRIVRRPKRRALTAASAPVTNPQVFRSTMNVAGRDDWQSDAWDYLDLVGELRYYVGWRSASCSRCRLVASELDDETGLPTGACTNPRVNEIVKNIAGGPLGQAQYVKRYAECLTVPGELWTAILITDEGEQWLALTKDEIRRKGNATEVELPTGVWHEFNPETDSMFRGWNPHPRRASLPDSPVRACRDSLREIVRTTKTIANASKSRLIGNGVLFVPQEMSLPANNPPPVAGQTPTQTIMAGTPAATQLRDLLWQVAETAVDDEDSMAALIPLIATVPGEQTQNVVHMMFGSEVTDVAIKTRNDAISRLAMGLDVSPERLLGFGETSNHWSSWLIDDSDVQIHIAPVLENICQALTVNVLTQTLEREGIISQGDPAKFVVWFDPSDLTADPDQSTNAANAFDRGTINGRVYNDKVGFGEDDGYDYTSVDGLAEWACDKVSQNPLLLPALVDLLPEPFKGLVNAAAAAAAEQAAQAAGLVPGSPETSPQGPPQTNPQDQTTPPPTNQQIAAAARRRVDKPERSKRLLNGNRAGV